MFRQEKSARIYNCKAWSPAISEPLRAPVATAIGFGRWLVSVLGRAPLRSVPPSTCMTPGLTPGLDGSRKSRKRTNKVGAAVAVLLLILQIQMCIYYGWLLTASKFVLNGSRYKCIIWLFVDCR